MRVKPKSEGSAALYREELNVVHRGLISIQRQLPDGLDHWTRQYLRDGQPLEVRCESPARYGVPHGIDNDVLLALQDAFMEQGCPEDNTVQLSLYRLLQKCAVDDTGDRRRDVRRSLDRLRSTTYWMSELWRSHQRGRWATVTFNILSGLAYERDEDDLEGARRLLVTLAPEIADSIRAGYVKPVDLSLYRQLGGPARAAFRVLDALRHPPEDPSLRVDALHLSLLDLALHFGLTSDLPDKIRRSLAPIHQELLEVGYLASVELVGRGGKQQVHYTFGRAAPHADPALVAQLTELGLAKGAAERLALECPHQVPEGVRLARAILGGEYRHKVRNRAALIVDVVRTLGSGKYAWPEPPVSPAGPLPAAFAPPVPPAPSEDTPAPSQSLAQTVAFLLGLKPGPALEALPEDTLRDLMGQALGKTRGQRKQMAPLLERLLRGESLLLGGEPFPEEEA